MITIVTVNWHCVDLIAALLRNLYNKAEQPDKLRAMIIDNTNGADDSIDQLKQCGLPCEIHGLDSRGMVSSKGHALALNHALNMADTEFTLVTDPDIYVFKQNWDSFCIDQLKKHEHLAIGAPYAPWKIGKYHNFPSPVFCFFQTKTIKSMQCDWTPHSEHKIGDLYVFVLRLLCRLGGLATRKRYEQSLFLRKFSAGAERIFGIFSRETGWRIAAQAKRNNMKSILFNAALPQDTQLVQNSAVTAFRELASEFELYYYNSEPILTHKYTTGSIVWRTKRGSDLDFWHDCIERFESKLAE